MVHKLLTKLRLTPGAPVMKCLKCHREGTVESVDGDTLAIPDAKIIAGGLAGSSGGYCFHALINFCSCTRCEDPAMSPPLGLTPSAGRQALFVGRTELII